MSGGAVARLVGLGLLVCLEWRRVGWTLVCPAVVGGPVKRPVLGFPLEKLVCSTGDFLLPLEDPARRPCPNLAQLTKRGAVAKRSTPMANVRPAGPVVVAQAHALVDIFGSDVAFPSLAASHVVYGEQVPAGEGALLPAALHHLDSAVPREVPILMSTARLVLDPSPIMLVCFCPHEAPAKRVVPPGRTEAGAFAIQRHARTGRIHSSIAISCANGREMGGLDHAGGGVVELVGGQDSRCVLLGGQGERNPAVRPRRSCRGSDIAAGTGHRRPPNARPPPRR